MGLITAFAATAAIAAGTTGAVTVYQLASPEPTPAPVVATADQGAANDTPRFAPCRKPARLEDGRCVTDLTRTVVLPGATRGTSPGAPAAPGDDVGTFDQGEDARRDFDDDELELVQDDDLDDDFDDGTHTRTRTHGASGTNTGTGGAGTSTGTGRSGTSG